MNRRHKSTPVAKAEWLRRRMPAIKTWGVRRIIEAMRQQGYFSKTSFWFDCQGVVCDFLGRERDRHIYGKMVSE